LFAFMLGKEHYDLLFIARWFRSVIGWHSDLLIFALETPHVPDDAILLNLNT
jgi:hypothetical protein